MKRIPPILLFFMLLQPLSAQVWPGDVNNNGIANNIDLLWYGAVYGEEGPPRMMSQQGINWESQNLNNPWADNFPNGVNYAFADCDGDGEVRFEDHSAIEMNYNQTHGTVTPDVFIPGEEGMAPPLYFESTGPITEGNPLVLSVNLGTEELPVEHFYGIAFTIRFDPAIFSPDFGGGDFSLENDSWLGQGNQLIDVGHKDMAGGSIEIGITRRNGETVDGFGEIGNFFIVIEDHVVGLEAPDIKTNIWFENIQLIGNNLDGTPVFGDSTEVTILNDQVVSTNSTEKKEEIYLYPNPAKEYIWINAPGQELSRVEWYNASGNMVRLDQFPLFGNDSHRIATGQLPAGTYFIRISTAEFTTVRKVLIE